MRNLFQKAVPRSAVGLIVALVAILAVGCGGSRDNFVVTNSQPVPANTGAVTFNFVQAQGVITVPAGTTTLDFTFYDGPNQTGGVTLTTTAAYAAQVTLTGVPTTSQSYQVVARNANGAALATATGPVTVTAGQTTVVNATLATTELTPPTNTALNVFVSNNGTNNSGDLDLFNQLFELVRTFTSGNNQGIALDPLGTGLHVGDQSVIYIDRIADRTGALDSSRDRTFNLDNTATTLKGADLAERFGYLILADFGGNQILVVSTQSTDNNTVATIASTAPWDVAYDDANDRLYVALTGGSVAVYDGWIAGGFSANPSRTFTATDLDNAHGIALDTASDKLVVSDVGDPNSASDGEIYVFSNASTASGTVTPDAVIGGANTLLGNPVDIDLANGDLRVAEKSNDRVLIFSNILQSTGGNLTPNVSVAEEKPESVASQAPITYGPDNSDIDGGVTVQNILVSLNPGSQNSIRRLQPDLTGSTEIFQTNNSVLESIKVDQRGDVFQTFEGGLNGVGAIARLANGDRDGDNSTASTERAVFTGFSGPKGLDLVDSRGLVLVADNGNNTVRVVGKESNFANSVGVTDLTSANAAGPTWDLDYDPTNDRLFVTKGASVLVYDNYLAGNISTATPSREINVTGGVFLHGIVYDAANDVLLLSDVGAVTAGANTDGLLFVINSASTATGATTPDITIDNGTLGNPVDIAYDGTNLYVAEKTNDLVERYDNIRSSAGGNVQASLSVSVTKPESISLVTGL